MSVDIFSLACDSLSTARLVGFKGTEALSRPYEIEVFFTVPTGTDVKGAVGSPATLSATRGEDTETITWHGVFVKIRLLHQTLDRALYRGLLAPRLWLARHSVRSFVQTKKKIQPFAMAVLQHGGLLADDVRWSIDDGSYPEEEFVAQYRESDLDFVSRWLEREGIYYYFEHPDGDGKTEVMVVVDDKGQHKPLLGDGTVRYFPSAGGDVGAGERLRELYVDYDALPASVLVTDYDYANPTAPLQGQHAVSSTGKGELREYGYRVFSGDDAARLAGVKAQSIACREITLHGVGNVMGLRAGYTFEIQDGPSELPAKWLAIEVRHAGSLAGSTAEMSRYTGLDFRETYRVEVVAIPADVQFRAPQTTPWPRIYGFENGVVDGQATSQYAQIDDQGRYLVRFKFDASDLPDGSASTYVRMMQPHGGTTEGHHFPLRKGTEVMISFQGGDPDRPLIAGVVPNMQKPSTVTSKNHTQNVIRTGGGNHMVADDLDGKQYVDMYSPVGNTNVHMGGQAKHSFTVPPTSHPPPLGGEFRSLDTTYYVYTEGTAGFDIGGEWWENVGQNKWVVVTGNANFEYVGTHFLTILGTSDEYFGGKRGTEHAAGRFDMTHGGWEQHIHGDYLLEIEPGGTQHVTGPFKFEVTAQNWDEYGTWKTHVGGVWNAIFDGAVTLTVTSGTFTISAPEKVTISSGVEVSTHSPKWTKTTPYYLEFFGTKNSLGIHKWDNTAINMSINVFKSEMTAAAASKVGFKADSAGIKIDQVLVASKKCGAGQKNEAFTLRQVGACIGTFGFKKM